MKYIIQGENEKMNMYIISKIKKILETILLVAISTISIFAFIGCSKNTDFPSRSKNGIVGYENIVVGDFKAFSDSGVLKKLEKLTFSVPKTIDEKDYYELMGMYIGDDYVYYYELDKDSLYEKKKAIFDISHHSIYSLAHPDKAVLMDEWAKKAAVNIITKDDAEGKMNVEIRGLVDETLDKLGLDSNAFGGTLFRYIINNDSKGEMLTAALDGDYKTLKEKYATLMADGLINTCFGYGNSGAGIEIILAMKNTDNIAEAGISLCKEIEKKVFPAIDVAEKFAGFVDKSFDIWADDIMDETYRYVFKKYADNNGNISDDDWDTVYSTIHGAWARYKSKGIGEEDLKQKFKERAQNETKIANKESELKKLVKKWDEDGLLNPYVFNYSRQWSVADRLKSLYNTRETIKEMFIKDGKLQMGSYKGKMTEEEFIEELVYKWTVFGTKERAKFYKWIEDEGIVKKPGENKEKNYAWVKVATEVEKKDDEKTDVYITTRVASENNHTKTDEYIGDMRYYEKATFIATCDSPPDIIYPDEEFPLHETITAIGETEHSFGASCWYKIESPDIHFGGTSGRAKFESAEGKGTLVVGTTKGSTKNWDIVAIGKLGRGREGEKIGIFFCGCDADTRWIYEWKEIAKELGLSERTKGF